MYYNKFDIFTILENLIHFHGRFPLGNVSGTAQEDSKYLTVKTNLR